MYRFSFLPPPSPLLLQILALVVTEDAIKLLYLFCKTARIYSGALAHFPGFIYKEAPTFQKEMLCSVFSPFRSVPVFSSCSVTPWR